MVQVVARMGYPVASLIIQKVNLVSVDDGEVPDGIICLPRWVIGLFDLVFSIASPNKTPLNICACLHSSSNELPC